MRLPRRVPWAHIGELEQVCSWIYTDENDLDAKELAVNKLAAWKAVTSLPHALESAHALLTVTLHDMALQSQGSSSYLSLRQGYSTAVIRLVNGLVDPLQLGAYARSINSIAAQLGLPQWLVELRHAATHEDLPSIEVLREAARQAMAWLLNNYFLPTLNPSAPYASQLQRPALRPIAPLLKQYKALAKATARDASLATKFRHDMARLLRDVERWIAEAKVAAPVAATAWDDIDSEEGEGSDPRERWALDRLAEALLEKGALVPVSKKKRMLSSTAFHPSPFILNIWTPLLAHLQSLHPSLPVALISNAVSHLSSQEQIAQTPDADVVMLDAEQEKQKQDATHDRCIAGWVNWLVDTYGRKEDDAYGDDDIYVSRADVVSKLVAALGPTRAFSGTREKRVQELLRALSEGHPTLEKAASLVLNMPRPVPSSQTWQEADMLLMHERLSTLLSLQTEAPSLEPNGRAEAVETQPVGEPIVSPASRLPPGWRRVSRDDGWKPSPIGVFVPCVAA
ncbi:Las1-like-domain-containing protein [Fomitopsis serialis]|uniref:Las1-like-domain-containing protein n=1 Tax=Fomitopsis serialis TaxID=139415 RepID=UPI0020086DA7|nr:Las1-like-domain-containing protein [Neoantrodia serialis]KAH9921458.1 Las1-like-domain-containing protein [Neoantrodia serialis]